MLSLLASLTDRILALPSWLVVALVFLFPALEASAFVGFVVPGEVAVILGGVVASQGRAPLWMVVVAAVAGAVIGDSVGYVIGKRWGDRLLKGTIGRLPVIRRHIDEHLESARAYVRRRKGSAVFFGRFTAALRVLVPGLAGMSDVDYPTFAAFNVAGGALWGSAFAVAGYVAGASYRRVERVAGRVGLVLLGLVVVGLVVSRLVRRSGAVHRLGERLANSRPLAWIRRRVPAQVAWLRGRIDPSSPRGFALTFALAVAALAAWAFGGITQDVVAREETALLDPRFTRWVVAHRTGALTAAMRAVTWLGSAEVIVPLVVVIGVVLVARRRDWASAGKLAAAILGTMVLSNVVKVAVERPRPPASVWLGHFTGWGFPSSHATQAAAFYGMLVVVVSAGRPAMARVWAWIAAALVVAAVGASRVYLGAHWLTDVLGGYALGTAWMATVVAITLAGARPRRGDEGTAETHTDASGRRRAA